MPGYVAPRRVTHMFVQIADVNPAGRMTGWRTVFSVDDDLDAAKARAKAERAKGHKVRIAKRAGVSGGYTSL